MHLVHTAQADKQAGTRKTGRHVAIVNHATNPTFDPICFVILENALYRFTLGVAEGVRASLACVRLRQGGYNAHGRTEPPNHFVNLACHMYNSNTSLN
jgi:hypothetical protein